MTRCRVELLWWSGLIKERKMVGKSQWVLGWSAAGVNYLESSSSFIASRKGEAVNGCCGEPKSENKMLL